MSLPSLIAGTPSTPWDTLPNLSLLRDKLIACMYSNPGGLTDTQKGSGIMALGQETEAYTICNNLHPEARDNVSVTRKSIGDIQAAMEQWYPVFPSAIAELSKLGVPDLHLNFLEKYLNATSPLYILSGIGTLITLAAMVL